jgi:hypothetical protein
MADEDTNQLLLIIIAFLLPVSHSLDLQACNCMLHKFYICMQGFQ